MARGNIGGHRPAFGTAARKAQQRAAFVAADKASLAIAGALAAAANGSNAAFAPVISGGKGPYTLTVAAGALPTGRVISGTTVTGTYSATGTFNYTLRVTDAIGATRDLPLTTTVS